MRSLVVGLAVAFLSIRPGAVPAQTASFPGLGSLSMATSARSDSAQSAFLRGVMLLHLFEYSRAREAFGTAERVEPDFAMAYWGEAMTYTHPVWDEQDLQAARSVLARLGPTPDARIAKAPTAREKAYLTSLEILYGSGPKARRDTLYSRSLEQLVADYPEDNQAHLFYALSLLGLSQGVRNVPTYLRAAAIADSALAREPHNPGAAHYLIHGVDDPEHAEQGLAAARELLETATDAGHGQHMASHIFMALGMWDEVVAANENAVRVVSEQAAAAGRPPVVCGHYPSWLEYGYLAQGRVSRAREVLKACHERASAARAGSAGADPDNSTVGSYTMMWARYLLDTGAWEGEVARWSVGTGQNPYAALTAAFLEGFGAARAGKMQALVAARSRFDEAARQIRNEADDDPGTGEFLKRVRVLASEMDGLARAASGDGAGAVDALRRAAATEDSMAFAFGPPFVDKPAHELLGEALLDRGRPGQAREAFEAALARARNRPRSLLGLARASAADGDIDGATKAYRELVDIWHAADADLPGLLEVRDFLASHAPSSGGHSHRFP